MTPQNEALYHAHEEALLLYYESEAPEPVPDPLKARLDGWRWQEGENNHSEHLKEQK